MVQDHLAATQLIMHQSHRLTTLKIRKNHIILTIITITIITEMVTSMMAATRSRQVQLCPIAMYTTDHKLLYQDRSQLTAINNLIMTKDSTMARIRVEKLFKTVKST